MTPQEMFSIIQAQYKNITEIPYPQSPHAAPAHEGKPYRDPHLYLQCPSELWLEFANFLKNEENLSFDYLTFVTALDYAKVNPQEPIRIEVVYHLYSFKHRHSIVVKISLQRENPVLSSVIQVWKTSDWQEREVYDMFGVKFEGHPNCSRILMWEGFPGWPLRKDYVHIPDRYDD
ncbi:MAG: NADH-quinone oxidoreductase subunit C [Elusimicrobia bacterium]|nr:NADH-quinone oxidoreductase subunit C [Elusimicrobiota bacterium]